MRRPISRVERAPSRPGNDCVRDEVQADDRPSARRRLITTALRVAVGVALIGVLLGRTDAGAWSQVLARSDADRFVTALVLMVAVLLVSSLRWLVFLRALGFTERPGVVIRLYLVGTFFNVFLPTGLGGDAYKVVRLGRRERRLSSALASVLLDRLTAILALAAIVAVATGAQLVRGERSAPLGLAALTSAGVMVAAVSLLAFRRRLTRLRPTGGGVRAKLGRVLTALGSGSADIGALSQTIFLGLIAQFLLIAAHREIATALHLDIPFAPVAGGVLLTILAATAPVTVNGLGVREAVWVWMLSAYGVDAGAAIAFALAALGMLIGASLVGGVAYVMGAHRGGEEPAPPDPRRRDTADASDGGHQAHEREGRR